MIAARGHRFLVAFALMGLGLGASYLLQRSGSETYALMVAAAAISSWYGGTVPSLLSTLVGWGAAWYLLADQERSWSTPSRDETVRWLVPLLASLIVIWVSWALRRIGTRAVEHASSAEQARFTTEAVQQLTSELSSALTPSDVAHTLVVRLPRLIGSAGAALGLIEGDVLRIVDPDGAPRQTLTPGMSLPLTTQAPIVVAARTGQTTFVATRAKFEAEYPDGARLAPYAAGALALPLRAGGTVVGAMGFPFEPSDAIDDDVVSLATLAAELGGQALERASLYDQERQSREALDRIARLAPAFDSESAELVNRRICEEAVRTFGSDVAEMWLSSGESTYTIVAREPVSADLPVGTEVAERDYPGLADSLARHEPLFIPDSLATVKGTALEWAQAFGTRSSLRVPISIGGRSERVLVLQWVKPLREVSPWIVALARRFADQAGLALEYAERREAQIAATQNAEETRRLLDVTAAMAAEMEPPAVAETALREAFRGLGASAGAVVRRVGDRGLELVSSLGYPDRIVAGWDDFDLEAERPLSHAVRRGEIVTIGSRTERSRRYPELARRETLHESWLCVPLTSAGSIVGGLGLSFSEPRVFTDADRDFALSLSRQAGQALERAGLLETEHAARMRAERMASDVAQLHGLATALGRAVSAAEVVSIVIDHLVAGVGAETAGIATGAPGEISIVSIGGGLDHFGLRSSADTVLDEGGPFDVALETLTPVWLVDAADWVPYASTTRWRGDGSVTLAVVPLVVAGTPIGALFVAREGTPTEEDRRLVETVARQAAQPLERVRLYESERAARVRMESTNRTIVRLQELTTALSSALSPDDVLDVFLRQATPAAGAVGVGVGLLDHELGVPDRSSWRQRGLVLPERWLDGDGYRTPLREVIETGRPQYYDAPTLARSHPEVGPHLAAVDATSLAFVPLVAGRRTLGIAAIAWDTDTADTDGVRAFLEASAGQCGQALDRALRYETERSIAETLQRSVLPETLPSMEGATVAARYLPGTAAVDVGGDWFDTIPLTDGRLGFIVGDVVGKGVQAASTMAQLRNGMRALTLDSSDVPSVVTKLNRLLDSYTDAPFATLAFLTVDPATHEAELLSAGHLPPLLVRQGEPPSFLEGARGLPLGVDSETRYETCKVTLEPGDVVVLYTDGLVERRDRSLDDGFSLLLDAATEPVDDPDELVDRLLERLIGDNVRGDDIAVLAVAFDRAPLGTFAVRLPADRDALVELRDSFGRWLERAAIGETDRRDLVLATWEASANAIEHAQEPSSAYVDIEASLSGDRVRVEISDSGRWREPEERPDRGLGLHLMQSLMTTLVVQPADDGTTVVMERALSRERAGEGGGNGADHRAT